METVNATQASQILGMQSKTILGHLRKGHFAGAECVLIDGRRTWVIPITSVEEFKRQRQASTDTLHMSVPVLERRISELEQEVEKLHAEMESLKSQIGTSIYTGTNSIGTQVDVSSEPVSTHMPTSKRISTTTRNRQVSGEDLPDGLIPLIDNMHGVDRQVVDRRIKSKDLEITVGEWKRGGKRISKALSPEQLKAFYDLFRERDDFEACPECPHDLA